MNLPFFSYSVSRPKAVYSKAAEIPRVGTELQDKHLILSWRESKGFFFKTQKMQEPSIFSSP